MQRFVELTLGQRVVANLLFVMLMVLGAFSLLRMPVERYPNIQFGKMFINSYLPGASPEEVETLVTRKIEEALEDVEDLEYVRSSSYRERSSIVIKFVDDCDYKGRYDDVRLKVLTMAGDLPESLEPPVFNFLDVSDWFPTISVNVSGQLGNHTLSQVADELKIPLSQIDGVREVKQTGDFTREFHVELDRERMHRLAVGYLDVVRALQNSGVNYPAGHGNGALGEFVVRVDEQYSSRQDLLDTVIRNDGNGSLVRLGDLAAASAFDYRDPFITASVNGRDCVTLQLLKRADGNALRIAARTRALVEQLRPVYAPLGVVLEVTQDSSTKIADSMRVLGLSLLLGVSLVCVIIWLFMGLRNALLTTIGIPFAFLVTLGVMYFTGNSINEVSLFAFVLVSGIIVDDAIVVVENIFRHQQEGKSIGRAVIDGTAEVFLPVVSATLTTVVAFLPMLMMTGMVGDFFAIIPKTIAFALAASLLECLLVLPCHYLDYGPRRIRLSGGSGDDAVPQAGEDAEGQSGGRRFRAELLLHGMVQRSLALGLRFRLPFLGLLVLLFLASAAVFAGSYLGRISLMRISFFPDDYSLYYAEVIGPAGTPLAQTHQLVKRLAAEIMKGGKGEAESALGFAGYYINEDFSPQYGNNVGYVAVTLPDSSLRRFPDYPENDVVLHLDTIRRRLEPLVPRGFQLSVRPEKDGPPSGKDLNIRVLGIDQENVAALARRVETFLQSNREIAPWLEDLQDDQGTDSRVVRFRVDGQRSAELGFAVAEVAALAASAMDGQLVGEMKLSGELIDIRLKPDLGSRAGKYDYDKNVRDPIAQAQALVLRELPGGAIRLGDVCRLEYSLEPGYLNRFQQQRAITLTANLRNGSPLTGPAVVQRMEAFYNSVRGAYPGAALNFAGEYESTRKSFTSLAAAFGVAVVVIYLILAAQFQSYLQPMIIIAAVIFALIGVVFGTVTSRTLFTVNSFVAVIGVTGVVVNDSLVLVEFLNRCYQRGMARREAVFYATRVRLRPILLTTLTTTLGLLPMALGIPEYSIIWGSMAMTFVTGLCTATFLTITVIPMLWDLVTELRERVAEPGNNG